MGRDLSPENYRDAPPQRWLRHARKFPFRPIERFGCDAHAARCTPCVMTVLLYSGHLSYGDVGARSIKSIQFPLPRQFRIPRADVSLDLAHMLAASSNFAARFFGGREIEIERDQYQRSIERRGSSTAS